MIDGFGPALRRGGAAVVRALAAVAFVAVLLPAVPAWPGDGAVAGFSPLFRTLESDGPIDAVLDRSKWPDNDRLASYLELELLTHPRYRATIPRLRRFLEQWPLHPQVNRVVGMLEWQLARHGGDDETFAWFEKHPPLSRTAKLRHLKLLLDRKQYQASWKIWQKLYQSGVEFDSDLWRRVKPIQGLITDADREDRARAFLWKNNRGFFRKIIEELPPDRRLYLQALSAAHNANRRFHTLIEQLAPRERKSSEVWYLRINGLRRHNFRDQAEKLLLGVEGGYLTDTHRQRLRFYLGRDHLVMRKPERALRILEGNVREKGAVLEDSLWLAAWSAHQSGNRSKARRWFALLADKAANPWRRAQGAYWSAEVSGGRKARDRWLAKAARYPQTFYGLLAEEKRSGHLPFPKEPDLHCPRFKNADTRAWIADLKRLRQVGRSYYNGPEIEQLAERQNLSLTTQLCLAKELEAPDLAIRLAKKLDRKGQRFWSGLYPRPEWTPLPGWGLDPALAWGMVRQESLFYHRAESSADALGVMQLLPTTAEGEAKLIDLPESTRYRLQWPPYNMAVGQSYLMRQLQRFNGDLVLALAAYNAGPHRADTWQKTRPTTDPLTFIEKIPFTETRHYVKRVIHGMTVYRLLMYGKSGLGASLLPGKSGGNAQARTAPSRVTPDTAPKAKSTGRAKVPKNTLMPRKRETPRAAPKKRG